MRSRTRSAAAWRWRFRASLAIAVPAAAAGLLLGPAGPAHAAGPLLYVPDTNTDTVSVVDASTNAITATVPVGTAPEYTAVTPDGSQVFVSSMSSVSVISTSSDTVTANIPLDAYTTDLGQDARQLVVDPAGAFVYVVTQAGYVVQISTATDTVTGAVYLGNTSPRSLAIAPDGATLYVSGLSSTVSVVDTASLTVRSVIDTRELQSFAIAVTPDGSGVYVAYNHGINVRKSDVAVISTATDQVTARVSVSPIQDSLEGIAAAPDGASVYVTVGDQDELAVISTATNTVTATVPGLAGPVAVALDSAGTTAWVSQLNAGDGSVAAIDTASDTITGTVPGFQFPFGLSVAG
jgi:YVTN family beta-propeller protein